MKRKEGFISNSSSTSFILICKNKKPLMEALKVFDISENHPLSQALNSAFKEVISDNAKKMTNISEHIKYYHWFDSIDDFVKSFGYNTIEELIESGETFDPVIKNHFQNPEWDIYFGEFESSGNSELESFLSTTEINFESEEIIFQNPGSY